MFEIDFGPVISVGLELLIGALLGVATWAVTRLGKRFGIEIDEGTRDYVRQAIDGGVIYAFRKVVPNVGPNNQPIVTTQVRNKLLAEAVSYVLTQVPDGLRRLNMTRENVEKLVTRALPTPADSDAPASGENVTTLH